MRDMLLNHIVIRRHLVDVGGVLISSFVLDGIVALAILLALRPLLARIGFQRVAWNPPLAEIALLICIFGVVTLLF
ncbi:DUF1656 domain-containing protein [Lichenicoccus roseus]|nr:DUF1656 domain-containing protein [Lichenicoccus roseus]